MLSSLLPGLREVRAPLAAGFVWLVALWFLLDPRWTRDSAAEGVIGSTNRLMDSMNLLGQGVVLSFAAYLVGSLSCSCSRAHCCPSSGHRLRPTPACSTACLNSVGYRSNRSLEMGVNG